MTPRSPVIFPGLLTILGLLGQTVAQLDVSLSLGQNPSSSSGAQTCPMTNEHFSYDWRHGKGPEHWPEISPCCAGSRQSPRSLYTTWPSICNKDFPPMSYNEPQTVTGSLYNNGHDPVFVLDPSRTTSLVGAPYTNGPYKLSNIHIHFNTLQGRGSEHAVNGYFYDAEVHLVHFKAGHGDVQTAVLKEDGLVVIGLMLEASEEEVDPEIVSFINAIVNLKGVGKEYAVTHTVNLTQLMPQSSDFMTYAGSLTTPPCSESVRWVVMRQALKIHTMQLAILTTMAAENGGFISNTSNDRPLQAGGTDIETNFPCDSK